MMEDNVRQESNETVYKRMVLIAVDGINKALEVDNGSVPWPHIRNFAEHMAAAMDLAVPAVGENADDKQVALGWMAAISEALPEYSGVSWAHLQSWTDAMISELGCHIDDGRWEY